MKELKNWALDKDNKLVAILSEINGVLVSPYTGKTLEEMELDYGKLNTYTEDEAVQIIDMADDKIYNVGKWKESDEEYFNEKLEILPPEKFTKGEYINKPFTFYRMSEYTKSNITEHHLYINGRYFYGQFRTNSYETPTDLLLSKYFI